jgi:GGDEF domain-containing protein
VGRWSEDRFVAIVENCTEAALIRVAELWRRLICLAAVPWWGDRVSVTVSIGGTAVRPDDTAESLLSRAEAALGASLAEGGDRVMIR